MYQFTIQRKWKIKETKKINKYKTNSEEKNTMGVMWLGSWAGARVERRRNISSETAFMIHIWKIFLVQKEKKKKKNAPNNNKRVQRRRNRRTKLNNHVHATTHPRLLLRENASSTFDVSSISSVHSRAMLFRQRYHRSLIFSVVPFLVFFFLLPPLPCVCYLVTICQSHTHPFAHIQHYLKQKGSSGK